jgi:UDP-N-acetylglucosamine acyltransferase
VKNYIIHPTAVVETEDIGEGTYIGPFTYISERVKIGRNCGIYSASIGRPGEHPNGAEDKGGIVIIGDDCEIREFVTINTPLFTDRTQLDRGCYLMAKSHVGHDTHLGERVVLHTGAVIGGHSTIGRYCYMGLNCSTHPFAELGDYCIVGANGLYKGKSPAAIVWAGVPSRPLKINTIGLERHADITETLELSQIAEKFLRDKMII